MAPEDAPVGDEWEGERVTRWLRQADGLERQLAPVTDVLVAAAGLRAGERVLDVGVGTGPTTRRVAPAVTPGGSVVALDVSTEMIEAARSRVAADGVEWVVADAATWEGTGEPFDVVLSQFGVMFFADPPAAFANLARLARPGARLCVAVWADRRESPLFEVPLQAALSVVERAGVPVDVPPPDEGPFSLGDPDGVTELLDAVGWGSIELATHRLPLALGGGLAPDAAAQAAFDFGPTRVVSADLDDDQRRDVAAAITRAFADRVVDGVVLLEGEVRIVTARRN